jgi:DNA polymerase-3 subunit beta
MLLLDIDRGSFLAALGAVVGVVERRHTLPILANVLIKRSGQELRVQATDLELQVNARLPDTGGEDFALTTGARKLYDIVRALPEGGRVKLETRDALLEVKCGRAKFTLQTLPAADFPAIETQAGTQAPVSIAQKEFKRLLQQVQFAMAQQDIRYYLNGMLLVLEGQTLRAVATDGHRLALAESRLSEAAENREVILPRKTIAELAKQLAETDDPVQITLGDNQASFNLGTSLLVSKIIDGKFPDYQRVVPQNHQKLLGLERQTAINTLQRAAILSSDKFRGVRLVMSPGSLRVVCNNNEQEEAQEEIEAEYSAEPLDIGFNVAYLLDGLAAVKAERITLAFQDPNQSVLLVQPDENSFKYVVMPMRI